MSEKRDIKNQSLAKARSLTERFVALRDETKVELEARKARQLLLQEEEERRSAEIVQERALRKAKAMEKLWAVFRNDFLAAEKFYESFCQTAVSEGEFRAEKIKFVEAWLHENLPNPKKNFPDSQQIEAISEVTGNVQLRARAGSGKTSTVVNRAFFLVKHCGVPANSILVTAFNTRAVSELEHRLFELLYPDALEELVSKASKKAVQESRKYSFDHSKMRVELLKNRGLPFPLVTTFHSLAWHIAQVSGELLQEDEDNPDLSRVFSEIKSEFLQNPAQRDRVRRAMLGFHKTDWERIQRDGRSLSRDEFLAFRRADSRLTLAGHYVKSSGEQAIANFLFENNVSYRYEAPVSWDGKGAIYKPDFLIFTGSSSALVVEYFGLAGQPAYDEKTEEKIRWFETRSNYSLLKLYPDDLRRGRDHFEGKIKEALTEHGVTLEPLSDDEIWERARKDVIDNFDRSLTGFVTRARNELLSGEDLRGKLRIHLSASSAEEAFVSLAVDALEKYVGRLAEFNKWDWQKVFEEAAIRLRAGNHIFRRMDHRWDVKNFAYFFIDEFQDFTPSFAQLVTALQTASPDLRLFCVGDDWQAINGFAGAKLDYFTEFERFFGASSVLDIGTNYRSARDIVLLGNVLMASGGAGAVAASKAPAFLATADLAAFRRTSLEKSDLDDRALSALLRLSMHLFEIGCRSVVILSRFRVRYEPRLFLRDYPVPIEEVASRLKKFLPRKYRDFELHSSTVHKFKGKEGEGIILLDCVDGSFPFVHPIWEVNRIFGDSRESLTLQERLLFYVGLTRAERALIFVTDSRSEISPFLADLAETCSLRALDWSLLPSAPSGGFGMVRVRNSETLPLGTLKVKELLKRSGFKFSNQSTPRWERLLHREEGFQLQEMLSESWAQKAEEVIVEHVDDGGDVLVSYLLRNGSWYRL